MTLPNPRVEQITTAEQYEAVLARCFERGEYLIVAEGRRPWIINEDERGDAWAWSWAEDDDGPDVVVGPVVATEALRLPLTVLYMPGEQSGPSTADVKGIVRSLMAMSALTGKDARAVAETALALAARPAETATATVEDAARVLTEHRFHGSTCLGCGYNARLDGYRASMHQAQALADAGLLATARTRPTEPTDAQVIAAATTFENRWNEGVQEAAGVDVAPDAFIQQVMRAALRAAWTEGDR